MRTGLSILGISLCVMLMLTVAAISQRYTTVVNQSYVIYSSNVVVISRASLLVEGLPLGGAMPETVASEVAAVNGVSNATPILIVIDIKALVPTNITIGIPIQNFSMFAKSTPVRLEGSYPTSNNQIVIGQYLASTTGLGLGSSVNEGGERLTVSGIFSTSNLLLSSAVVMPLQTAQSAERYDGLISAVLVSGNIQSDDLIQRINAAIPGAEAIDPKQSEFLSNSLLASIQTINLSVESFSILLAFLFVAIISSVNLLEQKNEFWTMRAIGSSLGSIMRVTLAETFLTSVVGFLLGLALSIVAIAAVFQSYASVPFVETVMSTPSLIPPMLVVFAGGVVVGFGMLVGAVTTGTMLRDLK
jgi:ABC-type lipoprotein release transport system permease subunit